MALPLASGAASASFINELDTLLEQTKAIRLNLLRAFPFLPADKATLALSTAAKVRLLLLFHSLTFVWNDFCQFLIALYCSVGICSIIKYFT